MNKQLRIILLLFLFLGKFLPSYSSHMMGADMSYQCLGNGKYKIVSKIYRDCRGISFSNPLFGAYAGTSGGNGCGNVSLSGLTRTDIRDVTTRCSSSSNPCDPKNTYGTGKGVEEHTFEITVDFSKSPLNQFVNKSSCCEVTFYIGQCCRNSAITTGASNEDFYTTCMINICNIQKTINKCNSSPQLSNEPVGFLCCNTPWYYNNGAVDTVDFDSISYKLVKGLKGLPNSVVSYKSPFTEQWPMTPFCIPPTTIKCTPRPNLIPPRGFFFDEGNGDIITTPTKCDEVPILVIEQTEWRQDSATGNWIVIGKTRRDMQMWVLDECGYNKPPIINGPFSWTICEGEKICKKIKITDETFTPYQMIADTVLATWNGGIPGATFKVVDPTKREKEYEFCWQTKQGQASEVSYSFTVKATDQHCTPPMISIRSFKVKVNPMAEDIRKYDTLKCGRFAMTANLPSNFRGTSNYQWVVRDSTGKKEYFHSTKKSDTMKYYYGGKYIINHIVNNSFNCPTIYSDTIILPEPPKVILATVDTFACYGADLDLKAKIVSGVPNYKYYWTRSTLDTASKSFKNEYHIEGDTNNNLVIKNINRDSVVHLRVKDANGCTFYDTAIIYKKPLPLVDLGADKRICTYEKQMFDAQNLDTVKYSWNTGDTTQRIYPNVKGLYSVLVTEKTYKCQERDTVELFVNDTVFSIAGPDLTICHQQSTKLTAQHRPPMQTATYEWKALTENKTLGSNYEYSVKPLNTNSNGGAAQIFNYSLYSKVNQLGHVCEDLDTMSILVNTLPVVRWDKKPLPSQCFDYGDIELNSFLNVGKTSGVRIWSGKLYKEDQYVDSVNATRHLFQTTILDNSLLQNGKNFQSTIYGWYKDDKGCINYDSTTQRINGNPIIEMQDKTYCQDLGIVTMDNNLVKPKSKAGINFEWSVLCTPSGIDGNLVLANKNPFGTPDYRLIFGDPTEDFYMGTYCFKLCIEDILTKCRSCDTAKIKIIGEPTVKVLTPDPLCVNWDTIDLYDYVTVNDQKGKDGDGGKFEITEVDYKTTDSRVGMSIPLGHFFPPSIGDGVYKFRYTNIGTGCLKVDSFYVYVNDTPDAVLLGPITLCSSGGDLDLTTRINMTQTKPSSGIASWIGAGLSGTRYTPVSKGISNIEGPISFTLAYRDNNGCEDTETYNIFVRTQPEVEIITPNPYSQCENGLSTLVSLSKFSDNKVFWDLLNGSDGSIDNINSENIVYRHGSKDSLNKKAFLCVTTVPLINDVCPPVSDSIQIIINPYPSLTPLDKFIGCVPLSTNWNVIEKNGIPTSQLSYEWIFGNGDTSIASNASNILYDVQGIYDLKLTVVNNTPDGGTCATTIYGPGYVQSYPLPTAYFETEPSYRTTVALPKFTMLNKSSIEISPFNPILSYIWNFGTGIPSDTSMNTNPRFVYSRDTGSYRITLTATSNHGCTDVFMRNVYIGPDIIVFVPDIFTPNTEGPNKNERFNPVITNYKTFNMMIYNRWGDKMFETSDANMGWGGKTANGVECQEGVYVYHLTITSFEDKEYIFDGTITLLR